VIVSVLWLRINAGLLVLVLFALIALIGLFATGVRGGPLDPPGPPGSTASVKLPGTPISGPTTITQSGHYYLTNDINVSGSVTAITITANNVSLDLGGFTIDGTDTAGSIGIATTSTFSVRIENGTVQDFQVGVSTLTADRSRIEDVHAVSNIRGIQIGARSVLADCLAQANTETGIVVLGARSVVRSCLVLENDLDGIAVLGTAGHIERNQVDLDQVLVGPDAGGTVIRDNSLRWVRVEDGSTYIIDNVCHGGNGEIVVATNSLVFIPPETAPHGNYQCPVEQEP
jgi:hypothetical protein